MGIHRVPDSLSRCDPDLYAGRYEIVKRLDIKPAVLAPPPVAKDTLEISKDRLKEEALSRLRHTTQYVIPQASFMRIGKYLFLAMALPPYMALYTLPKWILAEAVPAFVTFYFEAWRTLHQKLHTPLNRAARGIVQGWRWTHHHLALFIMPVVRMSLAGLQWMRLRQEQLARWMQQRRERLSSALWFLRWRQATKTVAHFWADRAQQAQHRIAQALLKGMDSIKQALDWTVAAPALLAAWGRMQAQRQRAQWAFWMGWYRQKWQLPRQNAERSVLWLVAQWHHAARVLQRYFAPALWFYRTRIRSRCGRLLRRIQAQGKRASHFGRQRHHRLVNFLRGRHKKMRVLLVPEAVEAFWSDWIGRRPLFFQKWLLSGLRHPKVRWIYHGLYQGLILAATQGISLSLALLHLCAAFAEAARRTGLMVGIRLNQLRACSENYLKHAYGLLAGWAWRGLYYLLLSAMILALLLGHGVGVALRLLATFRLIPFGRHSARQD